MTSVNRANACHGVEGTTKCEHGCRQRTIRTRVDERGADTLLARGLSDRARCYEGEEHYEQLRIEHEDTHVFRYDARDRKIANVAIADGIDPVGDVERVAVDEHLLLLGKAIQRSILGWLAGHLTII